MAVETEESVGADEKSDDTDDVGDGGCSGAGAEVVLEEEITGPTTSWPLTVDADRVLSTGVLGRCSMSMGSSLLSVSKYMEIVSKSAPSLWQQPLAKSHKRRSFQVPGGGPIRWTAAKIGIWMTSLGTQCDASELQDTRAKATSEDKSTSGLDKAGRQEQNQPTDAKMQNVADHQSKMEQVLAFTATWLPPLVMIERREETGGQLRPVTKTWDASGKYKQRQGRRRQQTG